MMAVTTPLLAQAADDEFGDLSHGLTQTLESQSWWAQLLESIGLPSGPGTAWLFVGIVALVIIIPLNWWMGRRKARRQRA